MKRVFKSVVGIILALIMMLSGVISAAAAEWDYTHLEVETAVTASQRFSYTLKFWPAYDSSDFILSDTLIVDAGTPFHCHYIRNNSTQALAPAYCFEPRREAVDNLYFTQGGTGDYSNAAWRDLTQRYPSEAGLISRVVGITNSLAGSLSRPEKDVALVAGQVIIREIFCQYRNGTTGELNVAYQNGTPFTMYVDTGRATNYHNYYKTIAAALTGFLSLPDFMSASSSKAPTTVLEWNNETGLYEATLTDDNGYLSDISDISIDGVNVSKDGNVLYLSTDTAIEEEVTSSAAIKNQKYCNAAGGSYIVWGAANGDRTQSVITSTRLDPVRAYMKVKTEGVPTITIEGAKWWEDNRNQDGIRPAEITIRLWADGVEIDKKVINNDTLWKWNFGDYPIYAEDGHEIVYSITEDVVNGYETVISDFSVINKHEPETIDIRGKKSWDDNDNQDGIRPEQAVINLLANGKKCDTAMTSEAQNWEYEFLDKPKYENGKEIVYTVEEVPVEGYTAVYTEGTYDITNKHTPETVSFNGEKVWEDNNNQDGIRPSKVTLDVLANGEKVKSFDVGPNEDGYWFWTVDGLPKYENGQEIEYEIVETAVEGYTSHREYGERYWIEVVDEAGNKSKLGYFVSDSLVRIWQESSGEGVEVSGTVEFPRYDGWEEDALPDTDGYEIVDEGTMKNCILFTNTHIPEEIILSGVKYWDDADNVDGYRPDTVTIRLYADGKEIQQFVLSEECGWKWESDYLPKYKDGKEIVYTISEDKVPHYETTIDGFDVINTHEPDIPYVPFYPSSPNTGDPINNSPFFLLTMAAVAILTMIIASFKMKKTAKSYR